MILEDIDRKPTKVERVAGAAMEASLRRIRFHHHEIDMKTQTLFREYFSAIWDALEDKYPDRPKRIRITARLDDDVVKFFKCSDAGYQAKMNEVLRMYMFARMAKYVEAHGARDRHGDLS